MNVDMLSDIFLLSWVCIMPGALVVFAVSWAVSNALDRRDQ